jgi:hypothetical protein
MEPLGFYSSREWAAFRAEALSRAGYQCEAEPTHDLDGDPVRCPVLRRLHVHHDHDVPLDEQDGLVFCPEHHAEFERDRRLLAAA